VVFPASAGSIDQRFSRKLGQIQETLRAGEWEAYATGYVWHLPYAYDQVTRGRLNAKIWGGGLGRAMTDGDGDRHSVYLLGFSDSHEKAQFVASYGWQRYLRFDQKLSLGWGYMAFLFCREDVNHYLPIPAALPCASIRFRQWEAVGLFVPHVSKDIKGDVFFVFLRTTL